MDAIEARLRNQVSRGEPVLFLGAGFSRGAQNAAGQEVPSSGMLTERFWRIAFPGDTFDPDTRLGDAYHAARMRSGGAVSALLRESLTVDAESLPDFYRTWFSIPWARVYTLNIDDLELAVARRFQLRRPLRSISATSGATAGSTDGNALEVIHLNGAVGDSLDQMTFADVDYARRQTAPDQWYATCVTDITSRPVVFVGTRLIEPILWQYIEYRSGKGPRGMRELRPGSYLVTPSLNAARRVALDDLNVDWVAMGAQEFAETVLASLKLESSQGYAAIEAKFQTDVRRRRPALVSELTAGLKDAPSDYLMGQEPGWSDVQYGRAIERQCDADILEIAHESLSASTPSPPLIVSGTAGSGKSTSLMRLGIRLSAEGVPVYWIDERSNIEPYRLRDAVVNTKGVIAILVDDADLWGGIHLRMGAGNPPDAGGRSLRGGTSVVQGRWTC